MSIYSYDNYRKYFEDLYLNEQKEAWFSCRKFSDRVGFSNPGFMNDMIHGRRNLTEAAAEKLADYFKLNGAERRFLTLLRNYVHAKSGGEREQWYREMTIRRNRSRFAMAEGNYYSDFRYPLVRTALMAIRFSGEYEILARSLRVTISVADLKRIIRNLCVWGMVEQHNDGLYVVTEQFVEPESTRTGQMRSLHREWIKQSLAAHEELDREERTITSQVMAVSRETAEAIDREIEEFREKIWKMVESDSGAPDSIRQLSIQYFPHEKRGRR